MQYGDALQDKRCAHCQHALALPLIYRDGVWYHAACFDASTQQWRHTMLLAAVSHAALPTGGVMSRPSTAPDKGQRGERLGA